MLRIIIILITSTVLLFSSCKKAKQNKLTGSWELLPQTAQQQDNKVIYTFDPDNKLYRTTNDTLVDTADYILRSEFLSYYVAITNLGPLDDANYYIEKINRKILILQCQSPYIRKEFTRYED